MSVGIRFECRDSDEDYTIDSFDWIEVDGDTMVAESDYGIVRHEQLAVRIDGHWMTADNRRWSYFVIYSLP
jgi:hypothetical protein